MGPACSYQSCQHLPVSANNGRSWTAQDINFLTGITARRHHSQVRNNPWTTFFCGIIRHQKFAGRSPPRSDSTAGPFLWPQAGRRPARVFLELMRVCLNSGTVAPLYGSAMAVLTQGLSPVCALRDDFPPSKLRWENGRDTVCPWLDLAESLAGIRCQSLSSHTNVHIVERALNSDVDKTFLLGASSNRVKLIVGQFDRVR